MKFLQAFWKFINGFDAQSPSFDAALFLGCHAPILLTKPL